MTQAEKELIKHMEKEIAFLRKTVENLTAANKPQTGLTREESIALQSVPIAPPNKLDDLAALFMDVQSADDLTSPMEE